MATTTELLKSILEAYGGDPSTLADNLESTLLKAIAACGGGSTGGGSASIDVTATVGQTIIVKEVDANGKPTKWEAAEYLDPLIGTTEEITPAQVADALLAGRGIALSYTDATFGQLIFNVFTYCEMFGGAVQSSQIFYLQGTWIASVLVGEGSGSWTTYSTYLQPRDG